MCGIAGLLLGPTSSLDPAAIAERMACAIAHRGPDDAGVQALPDLQLALAHRRLAILDLSPAGHQPMVSASGRYLIVFNGEIYNHLQLREQLESTGSQQAPWRGQADTETLLAAIEAWGLEATLQRCSGMAALALLDRRERLLHLVRDRFGEKPLYWGVSGRGSDQALLFGSDLAALRAFPGFDNPVDPGAVRQVLSHGCIRPPACIYAGIHQLPPGHRLTLPLPWRSDRPLPEPEPWWQLENEAAAAAAAGAAQPFSCEADALAALEAVLQAAVQRQSLADVPLGSFLSGGVDSSLITALLQAGSNRPVRSFTIGFEPESAAEQGFNEAPHARAVAARLGTDHREVVLSSADARSLIPELPRLYSEPFADSSQLPTHLVCREARRSGLTVALSGDGGDELFGGYNRHRLAPRLQRRFGALPAPLRRGLAAALETLPVRRRGLTQDKARKLAAAIRCSGSLEELQAALTHLESIPAAVQPLPPGPSPAERLMLADALSYLPADILVKVDRAAMAVGLETRAPFLDPAVAALAWRLPLTLKIRQGQGKWALRRLLERHLPPELVARPKAGFAMPIGPWLRGPLRAWAEPLLQPDRLAGRGWVDARHVRHCWQQHVSGRADHTPLLWAVLMLHAWADHWMAEH
ncbi:MAG: asparagine synthase (glutamine-hydrolyzing) [Cyanobacteriota bacterium]|nr:asparagine synthase (glutamine-hydrolyzing) [Cyanobacteriota bacterium]